MEKRRREGEEMMWVEEWRREGERVRKDVSRGKEERRPREGEMRLVKEEWKRGRDIQSTQRHKDKNGEHVCGAGGNISIH